MKVYDYKCSQCDIVEEHMVKNTESTVMCCKCDKDMVRLMGAPGMVKTDTGGRKVTK